MIAKMFSWMKTDRRRVEPKVVLPLWSLLLRIALLIAPTPYAIAQQATNNPAAGSGIFLTANDFLNNKLTYPFTCGTRHTYVRAAGRHRVIIKTKEGRHTYCKSCLFGFRDCGHDYRLFARAEYEILDRHEFLIYSQSYEIGVAAGMSRTITKYYFSESAYTSIFPLTRRYLSLVFRDNERFIDLINKQVQADEELAKFDEKTHMFLAETLLSQTID